MGLLLVGDNNPNTLNGGDDDDVLVGNGGADTLNGGGGVDTADYSQETGTGAALIDLLLNEHTDTFGAHDTLNSIENVIGTTRNDDIRGDFGANVLTGGGGNDLLSGRGGGDTLNGGAGDDVYLLESDEGDSQIVEAAGAAGGVDTVRTYLASYTLAANVEFLEGILSGDQTLTGTAAGDTISKLFTGKGTLSGLAGDDTLKGGTGVDLLDGGLDNDTLVGGAGADTLYGDAGTDTVRYDLEGGGGSVNVNLGLNQATDTLGFTDILSGIENIVGTGLADTIIGNGGSNLLTGLAGGDALDGAGGDDVLVGGAGADTLTGGAGIDFARYGSDGGPGGVSVNLQAGSATDSFGNTDTLSGIENVEGTAFADTLRGDGALTNSSAARVTTP